MNEDVVKYYTKIYDEELRLNETCDNRHIVEREVKKKILKDYIAGNEKVLEIGAGTGLYSLYLAGLGCDVSACDIVPKHVKQIKDKSKKLGLKVEALVSDALEIPYKDNSYNLVMLSGPIYHLHGNENKKKAIKEAFRVCKENGIIVVDYLSEIHGFIQHALISSKYLSECTSEEIDLGICKDEVFSYDKKDNIINIMNEVGIKNINIYGTDSITRFIREDINNYTKDELLKWISFIYGISNNQGTIELSEHCLAIGRKVRKR